MNEEDLLKYPIIRVIVYAFDGGEDSFKSMMIRFMAKTIFVLLIVMMVLLVFWGVFRLAQWGMSYFG